MHSVLDINESKSVTGKTLVSVIMPAYNLERYIAKSIESVLNQSYSFFELIIVNDGSKDGTEQLIEKYAESDKRIKIINQENAGVSVARNKGIELARGEYISFLDGDDLWHRDFLNEMLSYIENNDENIDFIYAKTEECFSDDRKTVLGGDRVVDGYFEDFLAPNCELRLAFHIGAMLVRRKLLNRYNIRFVPGLRLSEDTGFIIELLSVTKAHGLHKVLAYYMRRVDSATGEKKWEPEFWSGHAVIYEYVEEFVRTHRSEAMAAFDMAHGYVAYRFLLACLKHDYVEYAEERIRKWHKWLSKFANGSGKIKDRYKCKLIMISNRKMLRLIGIL